MHCRATLPDRIRAASYSAVLEWQENNISQPVLSCVQKSGREKYWLIGIYGNHPAFKVVTIGVKSTIQ